MTNMKENSEFIWHVSRHNVDLNSHVMEKDLTDQEIGDLQALSERARYFGIGALSYLGTRLAFHSRKEGYPFGVVCNILTLEKVDGNPVDETTMMRLAQKLDLKVQPAILHSFRREAANKAYEEADFGPLSVVVAGGWEDDGENRLVRKVFFETIEGPSRAMQFSVEFEPGLDVMISDADFELPEDDGNLVEYTEDQPGL